MKKIITLMAISAIALAGCAKNEPSGGNADNNTLSIKGVTTPSVETRAELSGTINLGDLGVFAYEGANYQNNLKYTYATTSWASSAPVKLTDVAVTVYAYYPWGTTAGTDAAPTLAIADNTTAQVDYLYSGELGTTYDKTSNEITTLEMSHALAKVMFVKLEDADYTGSGIISSIVLKNAAGKEDLAAAGEMDIKSGVITPTDNQATTYSVLSGNVDSFKDSDVSGSVMVLPGGITAAGDVLADVTMDGQTYPLSLPAGTWAPGTVNTYTLTVSTSSLSILSVTVKDWATGATATIPIE